MCKQDIRWQEYRRGGRAAGTLAGLVVAIGTVVLASQVVLAQPCLLNESAELIPSDTRAGDRFGIAVDVQDHQVIVGAYYAETDGLDKAGTAYIYTENASGWSETKLVPSDPQALGRFGSSVAILGDLAMVGASGAGAVYVFAFDGSEWTEVQKLTSGNGNDHFGASVDLSGDAALVGARSADLANFNAGAAYVFRLQGSLFQLEATLTASDGGVTDYFGTSVAISGQAIVVGAEREDEMGSNAGAAYAFRFSPNDCPEDTCPWTEEAKLTASDGAAGDELGFSVAISGDTIVVGARNNSGNGLTQSGAAYAFGFNGLDWSQQAKLAAFDGTAYDKFGYSVGIDGDTIAVGAKGADLAPWPATGAVYVFRRAGQSWIAEAKATDSAAYWDDWLGTSVAVSGDLVISGAEGTDLFEGGGFFSGSAFIFDSSCDGSAGGDSCPGDLNNDGMTDSRDMARMLGVWNTDDPIADISGDGTVNGDDLAILLSNWGLCE